MSAHDIGRLNSKTIAILQSLSPLFRVLPRGLRSHALTLIPGMLAATLSLISPAHAQSTGNWTDEHQVYAKVCGRCHETGVGPVITGRNLAPEYYQRKVRSGLRAMPAFRSSEIDDALLAKLARMLSATPASGK